VGDLLPSPEAGPEAAYARSVLFEEMEAALDELPEEQREVFVAHEFLGYSFKELAKQTGVRANGKSAPGALFYTWFAQEKLHLSAFTY
jgi:RNA polymerase sigma factor (sigma-70 family)